MNHGGHRSVLELQPSVGAIGSLKPASPEGHLIVEDGWVFREHHGKYVECICRSADMPELSQTPHSPAS